MPTLDAVCLSSVVTVSRNLFTGWSYTSSIVNYCQSEGRLATTAYAGRFMGNIDKAIG